MRSTGLESIKGLGTGYVGICGFIYLCISTYMHFLIPNIPNWIFFLLFLYPFLSFGGAPYVRRSIQNFRQHARCVRTLVSMSARALWTVSRACPVKQVLQIHLSLPPGDILVFMTGQEDIQITCQVVNGKRAYIMLSMTPHLLACVLVVAPARCARAGFPSSSLPLVTSLWQRDVSESLTEPSCFVHVLEQRRHRLRSGQYC
ncbi:hypothetical protein JB92DRAFT_2269367 [Gautieria morchelliformis]|nr:hypothetical protein JB92DRAFT_2269367 [Gautieria morchelliformis]